VRLSDQPLDTKLTKVVTRSNDFLRDAPKTIRVFIEEYKSVISVTAGGYKELIALLNVSELSDV